MRLLNVNLFSGVTTAISHLPSPDLTVEEYNEEIKGPFFCELKQDEN